MRVGAWWTLVVLPGITCVLLVSTGWAALPLVGPVGMAVTAIVAMALPSPTRRHIREAEARDARSQADYLTFREHIRRIPYHDAEVRWLEDHWRITERDELGVDTLFPVHPRHLKAIAPEPKTRAPLPSEEEGGIVVYNADGRRVL